MDSSPPSTVQGSQSREDVRSLFESPSCLSKTKKDLHMFIEMEWNCYLPIVICCSLTSYINNLVHSDYRATEKAAINYTEDTYAVEYMDTPLIRWSVYLLLFIVGTSGSLTLCEKNGKKKVTYLKCFLFALYVPIIIFTATRVFCQILYAWNFSLSIITVGFLVFNLVVLVAFVQLWKAPQLIEQIFKTLWYTTAACVLLVNYSTDVILWILVLSSIIDIFLVLPSWGPIGMLLKKSKENAEDATEQGETMAEVFVNFYCYRIAVNIPSGLVAALAASQKPLRVDTTNTNDLPASSTNNDEDLISYDEERPLLEAQRLTASVVQKKGCVLIGAADFIFYATLIGKIAETERLYLVVLCLLVILLELTVTRLVTIVYDRAMPALPLSIFSALLIYSLASPITSLEAIGDQILF